MSTNVPLHVIVVPFGYASFVFASSTGVQSIVPKQIMLWESYDAIKRAAESPDGAQTSSLVSKLLVPK